MTETALLINSLKIGSETVPIYGTCGIEDAVSDKMLLINIVVSYKSPTSFVRAMPWVRSMIGNGRNHSLSHSVKEP